MIAVRMGDKYLFEGVCSFAHKKRFYGIFTDMFAGRTAAIDHDIFACVQINSVSLSDVDEGDFISRIFEGEKYKTAKKKQ